MMLGNMAALIIIQFPGPQSTEHFLLHTSRKVGTRTFVSKLVHYHFVKFLVQQKTDIVHQLFRQCLKIQSPC